METIRAFMETIRAFMETIRAFMEYIYKSMHICAEFNGDIAKICCNII